MKAIISFVTCTGVLNILLSSVLSFTYGPSIYSLTKDEALDDDNSTNYKKTAGKTLYLSEYSPTFSVLLPLVDGRSFVNHSEALTIFKYLHHGEFYVVAPDGWGIIAVVQILSLSPVFGGNGRCLDYLQFTANYPNNVTETSPKICGIIDPRDNNVNATNLIGPRSFISASSKLTVEIFLFSTAINTEWRVRTSHLETTDTVELALTAFPILTNNGSKIIFDMPEILNNVTNEDTTGDSNSPQNMTYENVEIEVEPCSQFSNLYSQNIPDFESVHFKPCGNPNNSICIHQVLFCDSVIHCPTDPGIFNWDEQECQGGPDIDSVIREQKEAQDSDSMANNHRVIPVPTKKVEPLKVEIAHWSIISLGFILILAFIIVLTQAMRFKGNFCTWSGNDPAPPTICEVERNPTLPEVSDLNKRDIELIERLMHVRRQSLHIGNHVKL